MRKEFGKLIVELAEKDDKVILIAGDIGYQIFDEFREKFPDRFINLGVCEQSMISLASGMALEGLKPYVYTITPFLIERPFEQIKLDINEQNVNVKLVGYADYPQHGPTHTELNAEKLMSLFNNIKSYFPKNSEETRKYVLEEHEREGPAFISLKKDKPIELKVEPTNVDAHKLMYHPKRVGEWKSEGDCFPIYMEIGPTNSCNHKCTFCALDFLTNKGEFIDTELMVSTLKEMGENGVKSVMFAGEGEPLVHKDIGLFVETAKQSGIDISITTNGVLFNKEKAEQFLHHLSWIRFSVDAGTSETYNKIHRGGENDFDKVIENIKNAVEIKKAKKLNTVIGIQFLMISDNINDVLKLAQIAKDIGADNLQIKPYSQHPKSENKFVINYKDYAHLEKELEQFNSPDFKILFRKQTMKRVDEGINYSECHGLPFFALIDSKGNIIPCNLFYDLSEFTYGNLYENSFSEIWKGEKRKQVLQKLKEKGIEDCRHACRLDVINRYLERLKNPQLHDNFV